MEKKPFRPNFFFVFAILAVVGLAYYARRDIVKKDVTFRIESPAPEVQESTSTSNPSEDEPVSVARDTASDDRAREPLRQWVREEAKSLNLHKVDREAHERKIEERVRGFGAQQLRQLKAIAQDDSLAMNERILSTYMLGKSESANTHLIDIAAQAMENKDFEPHSEGEIKNTQERAIKIMAVDAIVNGPQPVGTKLNDLQQILQASNDDMVRDYAQKRMDELRQ